MSSKSMLNVLLLFFITVSSAFAQSTFDNPLMEGADPWVIRHGNARHVHAGQEEWYYYMHTTGKNLTIWKTKDLHKLSEAPAKVVWEPPTEGPNSQAIWAPELHFIDSSWYIYYTATDQADPGDHTRYVFVLENHSPDPLQGTWKDKGRVNTHYSGLDGSVFEHEGKRYFVYSGYVEHQSNLFISEVINPWTISDKQVEIASPTHDWEKYDGREICEGPQFLKGPEDKIFIVYSASACWDDDYCLGMLSADKDADLLDAAAWQKSPQPVFRKSVERNVFGPGHNCFSKSADGKEDLIVYHAKSVANQACRDRNVRIQPFQWRKDGAPDFGKPLPTE